MVRGTSAPPMNRVGWKHAIATLMVFLPQVIGDGLQTIEGVGEISSASPSRSASWSALERVEAR